MTAKSVLVTGASGMIGTALIERLHGDGYDVTGVDIEPNRWSDVVSDLTVRADLLDDAVGDALPTDIDILVHLAANARVHRLVKNPRRARDNFEMTFNVLEYARQSGVSRVIFGSSREVYGNKGKIVYSEEDTYVDECESPYTASKVGGEAMLKAYEQCYDLEASILRFSNVYGRFDVSDRVLPLFIAQAHDGQDLTVYGDDKVLDFTYLDDCVEGIVRVIEKFHKAKGTTFNIASGEGTSLIELAEEIARRVDTDVDIHVEPNRTGEVGRYVADISKANKVLNYDPVYSFDEGLDAAVDWYTGNPRFFDEIR
ncbi:NAD-dependent epimerase/dehydratase family protein [Haloplanus natans]|uniref:NAD-dependent epimerase/dehydratase family protein n=1 Tax=Haloplanus natans TaxID=376171 RepID=UPI00067816B2|nr:NAD-dependent epimerase/dehydratase family protein [Haloplanus natans]